MRKVCDVRRGTESARLCTSHRYRNPYIHVVEGGSQSFEEKHLVRPDSDFSLTRYGTRTSSSKNNISRVSHLDPIFYYIYCIYL